MFLVFLDSRKSEMKMVALDEVPLPVPSCGMEARNPFPSIFEIYCFECVFVYMCAHTQKREGEEEGGREREIKQRNWSASTQKSETGESRVPGQPGLSKR